MKYVIMANILATVILFVLFWKEHRKNLIQETALQGLRALIDDKSSFLSGEIRSAVEGLEGKTDGIQEVFDELKGRVGDLEKGLVPDYDAAVQAVNAVNDFNTGLNNLLGYDESMMVPHKEGDAD